MTTQDLHGVYTATVTPVNADRTLDTGAAKVLMEYYIENGIKGVLIPSSSGEYFAMTAKMKRQYVEEAVKAAKGKLQILANISDSCPEVILENACAMTDLGADALVCQPPQFHGYSQEECITFYHTIADRVDLPIIAYSHMTALPTKPTVETVIEICNHENIIGIKDTHRIPERIPQLKKAMTDANADFTVFLGGDYSAARGAVQGFDILNALSAIRPDLMVGIWEAAQAGDHEKAFALQAKVDKLVQLYFCLRGGLSSSTLFSMSLKLALEQKGLCKPHSVILGFEANEEDRAAIKAVLDSIDADG